MPLAFALLASLALHISALVSGPFGLPDALEQDLGADEPEPVTIHARLNTLPAPQVSVATSHMKPAKPKRTVPPPLPATTQTDAATATPLAEPPKPLIPEPAAPLAKAELAPEPGSPPPSLPVEPPPLLEHAQVSYSVTRGDGGFVIGRSRLNWSREGLEYVATSVIETTGLAALFKDVKVTQESRGRLDVYGLHPEQFRNAQIKRTDEALIDRSANRAANNGREVSLQDWGATVQDLLSMYYQLALLLKRDQQVTAVELPIVTGRKLALYHFDVLGTEQVQTPAGEFDAIRLKALNGEDVIELWYAPAHYDVPVRLRFTDRKKDVFEQNLEPTMKGTSR